MGMPTWHPHPKNPSWPLPFGSALLFWFCLSLRLRLRGFAAPCLLLHAHVKLQSETWGAWSMRPRPPSSLQPSFWGLGKGRQYPVTTLHNSHQSRPCPPFPLWRTLKKGRRGGWGEVRRLKDVGIRGRGRSPTPRRSLPVYACSSLVCVCICINQGGI